MKTMLKQIGGVLLGITIVAVMFAVFAGFWGLFFKIILWIVG